MTDSSITIQTDESLAPVDAFLAKLSSWSLVVLLTLAVVPHGPGAFL